MAKSHTRPSISVSGRVYRRLVAKVTLVPVATFVEAAVVTALDDPKISAQIVQTIQRGN